MFSSQEIKKFAVIAGLAFAMGCAGNVKKVDIPESANPADELTSIRNDLNKATETQADVLAPKSYNEAQEHLQKAQKLQDKNADNKKVLEEVGYARAYYNKANETAARVTQSLGDVAKTRQDAVAAGAHQYQKKELAKADDELKSLTKKFEKEDYKVDAQTKTNLQNRYMSVELESIKGTKLGAIYSQIEQSKKMGAKKLAPKSLDDAQAKYKAAEASIVANRHNETAMKPAIDAAAAAAARLTAITQTAKSAKGQSTEDLATDIVNKGQAIQTLDAQVGTVTSEKDAQAARYNQELNKTHQELSQTSQQLTAAQIAAQKKANQLDAEQKFNASFEEARKQFKPEEADVYRQGNNLLIRLKGLNFTSGRSELPTAALPILAKTKSIIKEMNADKVVVEGHTDSVGDKATNSKLSQSRADAVAKYFVSEEVVPEQNVEAKGYGFDKPVSSNKTKEGRAQNRRVDVIITPAEM